MFLEVHQLGIERGAFGYEVGRAHLAFQRGPVQSLSIYYLADVAQVQHAHDIVDVVAPYRQARVGTGLDAAQDVVVAVVQVDAVDLVARHHDIVDGNLFQRQQVEHHVLASGRDQGAALRHQGAQLFLGQVLVDRALGVHSQHMQQAVGDAADQPHQRVHDFQQRQQDEAGGERNLFGVQGGDRLGGDLGKDQHHQGQGHGGDENAGVAPQANGDDGGNGGGENVDQVVADQDQADKPVRALQQLAGAFCAMVVVFLQVFQPIAVERHHACFRTGKKSGKEYEGSQNRKK